MSWCTRVADPETWTGTCFSAIDHMRPLGLTKLVQHPSELSPLFLRGGKSSYPLARHLKPWNKSRDTRRLELQSTVSGSAILRSHSASPQMEWHTKASLG